MKKEKLILMLAVVCLMSITGPAWAVPWWDIGAPGSTYQMWAFDALDNPSSLPPEVVENPYGTASALIYEPNPQWYDDFLDRQGVWSAQSTEEIVMDVPNRIAPDNSWKDIYVEIGFHGQLKDFAIYPMPAGGVIKLTSQKVEIIDTNWNKLTALWHVEPNPNYEYICYSFSHNGEVGIDYVIVSTICVPEPMTVCLLGLGGLLLRRRKTL